MTAVDMVPAVYARLDNRPGTLQQAARLLAEHRINVDAVSLETSGSQGFARFLTHKTKEAVDALRKGNIDAHESHMVVAAVPNRAGELARVAGELAAAGLNVESIVTTTDGRLAFRTNDPERTAQILRKL